MRRPEARFVGLLGLAAAVPTAEIAVLTAIDFISAMGLSPQSTAVWPYDSYHDMRWLLVYHNSWTTFVLGFLALVGLRGLLSAALIALAWPEATHPLPFGRLVLRNLSVATITAFVVSPFAALSVAAAVSSLSWFVFASLGPLLLLAPFLQRAAVGAGWWRGLPSAELVGWSLLNFVLITVTGAIAWRVPGWWALTATAVCGAANGLLWQRSVQAAVCPEHVRWRRVPVAPLAIVLAMLVPLAWQSVVAVSAHEGMRLRPLVLSRRLPADVPYAVVVLGGHNSTYDGSPAADPRVEQFSYAGTDAQGRPRPYPTHDTHQSLESSAKLLARQVDALHTRTGRPIALLGESEGAMVARTYLRDHPNSPVKALLMFSPLIRAARVYYPPPDENRGWGLAAGWQLRGIFAAVRFMGHTDDSPDEPFIRSLLRRGPFYRYQVMCPIPGVRVIAFLPTVSATELPPGSYRKIPVYQTPSLHGGLLNRDLLTDRAFTFLEGTQFDQPRREYGTLQLLGAAWQAPPLAVTLNPVWRAEATPGPLFSTRRLCEKVP